MKVYYDSDSDCIFIEGTRNAYPSRSVTFEIGSNGEVTFWITDRSIAIARASWQNIEDIEGNTFQNGTDLQNYLTKEFKQSKTESAHDKQFNYDSNGTLTSITDIGTNHYTNFEYDSNGNLVQIITHEGKIKILNYDSNGQLSTVLK